MCCDKDVAYIYALLYNLECYHSHGSSVILILLGYHKWWHSSTKPSSKESISSPLVSPVHKDMAWSCRKWKSGQFLTFTRPWLSLSVLFCFAIVDTSGWTVSISTFTIGRCAYFAVLWYCIFRAPHSCVHTWFIKQYRFQRSTRQHAKLYHTTTQS